MKRCPTCNKTFTDRNLTFCIDDGTPLVSVDTPEDEATVVSPSSGPTSAGGGGPVPPYQPPASYVPPGFPPGQQGKRKTWLWIVAILAILLVVLSGLAIAAAILIPRMIRDSSNRNTSNFNANINRQDNDPANRNGSNANATDDEDIKDDSNSEDTTPPPTDEAAVLSQLTDLEYEWTIANINADKKKLDRILADDYVGTDGARKSQGKAEYLRTIQRDTSIQKWEFEDLKVSLKGDRATLTGIIRLVIQDQNVAYRFTDKFVWRAGRWQATGSEVTPVK